MDERRRAERLPITIGIQLKNGAGITRDVSGLGVYFTAAFPFERNEEIVYSAELDPPATKPSGSGGSDSVPVDVAIYRLTADGKLEMKRRLSEKWPVEMKPTYSTRQSIFGIVRHAEPATRSSNN